MVHERYITENPFRVLSIGSGVTLGVLRRRADSAARAAAVGLAPEAPLHETFGAPSLEELPSAVRGLATDRPRRTIFRIMWPLSDASIPLLASGGPVSHLGLSEAEAAQLQFLSLWFAFLEHGESSEAAAALDAWYSLYRDEAMNDRLVSLLVEEDGLEESAAYDEVVEARSLLGRHLLERVASESAKAWEGGETTRASQLATALLDSPLEKGLKEVSLDPLADCGRRLDDLVLAILRDMPDWYRGGSTEAPKEVVQLGRLADLLGRWHPSAADWANTAETWRTALGWRMREESLRLNEQGKNAEALDVIQDAQRLATDPKQKAKFIEDAVTLGSLVREEKEEAAYAGILPIGSAPEMHTLNGWGTKLYGRVPFSADRRLHFAILYITAFFFPVIPIKRYLVEDAGTGWRFYGCTRWTSWMKVHLGMACTAILAFGVMITNSASTAHSAMAEEAPTSYTSSASLSPMPYSREPEVAPTEQETKDPRRERLEGEIKTLDTRINDLDTEIEASETALAAENDSLLAAKSRIDKKNPDPYSKTEIDDYNASVRQYESRRAHFNALVDAHNKKVRQQKRLVQRYNDIVKELNPSRWEE